MKIPYFDSAVPTTRSNSFAIVADTDAPDPLIMSRESANEFSGLEIPYFDGPVPTAGNNSVAIVADTDAIDTPITSIMCGESAD